MIIGSQTVCIYCSRNADAPHAPGCLMEKLVPSSKMKGVPGNASAAHIAGRAIYARGPSSQEQVLTFASFGATPGAQTYNLAKAITNGWFIDLTGGLIGLSDRARHYYAGTEPEPKPMGSLATPREVKPFRPMSPQYRVDSRGTRADALNNSLTAMPSHYAKAQP